VSRCRLLDIGKIDVAKSKTDQNVSGLLWVVDKIAGRSWMELLHIAGKTLISKVMMSVISMDKCI